MDWIATDLDRTLFCRTWNERSAVPATWRDVDGARQPSSWMPADTHRLLRTLQRDFRMVVVTARDLQSFRRVALPGITLDGPSVIANGAIILEPGGSIDRTWSAGMARELTPWRGRMGSVAGRLEERFGDAVRSRMVLDADGQPAYVVAKSAEGHWARADVAEAVRDIDLEGLVATTMGPELQLLPPCISKRRGLAEVAARWFNGAPPTLALGDARGDLGFMRLAKWLAAPRGSELEASWA